MVGTTLSHFKITAKLGEGGMGEVYRAEDTKLGRDVALKILPEAVATDSERLARFELEAKILGSLNHPNIAAIHQVEESNGVHFIVMELVEGEDLQQLIARGAVPVDEALRIALQIAEALEAAHEKGIIHRDLKPANVMLTSSREVKVLDFGLAKTIQSPSPDNIARLSQSPTLAEQMTTAGTLMGTAPYMSPEQARGQDVDRLADIWAFGLVLYELLTGRRGFDGRTATDVLAAVLTREPDWGRLPADLPSSIRRLLRRCLTREPRKRLQSLGNARLEILDAADETTDSEPPRTRASRFGLGALVAVSCVSLMLGVLGAWRWSASHEVADLRSLAPVAQFTLQIPREQAMMIYTDEFRMTLSPDGKRLAWNGGSKEGNKIYIKDLDSRETRELPGTANLAGAEIKFSPDGRWVAFNGDRGRMYRVAVEGGVPAQIYTSDTQIWYLEWEDNDTIILSMAHSGLTRLTTSTGSVEPITHLDREKGEVAHERMRVLPEGKGMLFSVGIGNFHDCHIEVLSFASGERHTVIEDASVAEYVDSGHLVFVRDGTVFAMPFDLDEMTTTGPEAPVLTDIQMDISRRIGQLTISPNGTLVYFPARELAPRNLVWIDRQGVREEIPIGAPVNWHIDLSPNGEEVALVSPRGHSFQVYTYDFARRLLSRLTSQGSQNDWPVWDPSGRQLAIASNRDGQWNLFVKSHDQDTARRLATSPTIQWPTDWSPDGRLLAFVDRTPADDFDLWLLPLDGENPTPKPLARGPGRQEDAQFSPDGKWVAFMSEVDERYEVFLADLALDSNTALSRHQQVSLAGGRTPVWSPTGDELFYLSIDGTRLLSVPIGHKPDHRIGREETVLSGLPERPHQFMRRAYDVAPNGERFLFVLPEEQPEVQEFVVITDWREVLRQATQ